MYTQITDILCYILVSLGIIGNLVGLFIFFLSDRAWRKSSTYIYLATCSSIINLFCVIRYALLLHSKTQTILYDLIGERWWACKIYELSFSFRLISSWITLFWMFERLLCISNRLRLLFKQWNSCYIKFIIPFFIISLIVICVIGPSVYLFQPTLSFFNRSCGFDVNVSSYWKNYFNEKHFGINYFTIRSLFSELIPGCIIILIDIYIVYHLLQTSRRLHKISEYQSYRKQSQTTLWMNIILVLHSFLFILSLFSHLMRYFIDIEIEETWWISLTILINCSLNFYIYCLSGQAFRNEIRRLLIKIYFLIKIYRRNYCCYYKQYEYVIYRLQNHHSDKQFIVVKQ